MSGNTGEDDNTDHDYYELSSAHSNNGQPSWVVEGLFEPNSSPRGLLSDELRDLEDEFRDGIAMLRQSPSTMSIARMHTVINKQRYYLGEAQTEIVAIRGDLIIVDNHNQELAERLSGISTVHVLVCLERDQLKRFNDYALRIVIVLITLLILLLFIIAFVVV